MQFLKEYWSLIAAAAWAWFSRIENEALQKIVSLLTILAISLGLIDWIARKILGKVRKQKPGSTILEKIEGTQKPFKTVNMLDNPIEPGEKIGKFVDKFSKDFNGGITNMKKFIKWVWYNKEQIGSIAYNVVLLAVSQLAIWAGYVAAILPMLPPVGVIIAEVVACVLSVGFTVLTVRNVCVKYGLSSLDTIDQELAKRAEAATNKLTTEQKKKLKADIATLQQKLEATREELANHEKALTEITTLYTADISLAPNYAQKRTELNTLITRAGAVIANLETKIAEYKAQLSGKSKPQA